MLMHYLVEDNVREQMREHETFKKNFINFYFMNLKKKVILKKDHFFFGILKLRILWMK